MNELLKKLGYSDDDVSKITKGMKDEKIYLSKEENIDDRYSKLKQQKEDLEKNYGEASKTIKDLQKANVDNETLQATIKTHEETIKTLKVESEEKVKNLKFDNAISSVLAKNKARHTDLLVSKIDKSKLSINDNDEVIGLDTQIQGLKDNYKDLFEVQIGGKAPNNNGGNPGVKDPFLEGFDSF